ncbi:recombinase family protein [Variovorax sp. 375MFSha3.1]|uniref:recombinase family protein n=1 Tax=Variovorax sp. 375MFSha3.1 TaxID=3158364 RepID=UPI003AAC8CB6
MLIGYARVSTNEQETRLQRDALRRAGVRQVFAEKTSSVGARPELQRALASMKRGDVLVVWKMDRLARSLKDLLSLLERLEGMGCSFRSLTEPVDTSSAIGELVLQILGSVAQFERRLIRERAIAGQVAAYQRGIRWGGQPRVLSDEDAEELVRCKRSGYFSNEQLSEMFGCSISTVYRTWWLSENPSAAKLRTRGLPVLGAYMSPIK